MRRTAPKPTLSARHISRHIKLIVIEIYLQPGGKRGTRSLSFVPPIFLSSLVEYLLSQNGICWMGWKLSNVEMIFLIFFGLVFPRKLSLEYVLYIYLTVPIRVVGWMTREPTSNQ